MESTTHAPAPPTPEWLARLFPHTGTPGRLDRRLRRLEATEIDVNGRKAGAVVVELAYPGLDGRDEAGQARVFLPPEVRDHPGVRVPLIHNAGYEVDDNGALDPLAKGYAVSTPHAHPLNPLGRGVNLDRAILHAACRLPFVDPRRVSIQGGSAGGYMALMLAADAFPIVWAMPDVPPIHWGYNGAYIAEHQAMAAAPEGSDQPRMPILQIVGVIAEQSMATYGIPFDSPDYLAVSPLAHLDTVTAPTRVTFSTADMLVPVDQVGAELVRPPDTAAFPQGFSTSMTDRFPPVRGKRTLLDALPRGRRRVFVVPSAPDMARLGADGVALGEARRVSVPFAEDRVWSIIVLDEGPVEPHVGHFKYAWSFDNEAFRTWAEGRGVQPGQLTLPKLRRLMKRLCGEPWRSLRVRPGGQGEVVVGNQLDYPEAERADVMAGLRASAQDDACAARLAELYTRLPARLQVLGICPAGCTAAGIRGALEAASA